MKYQFDHDRITRCKDCPFYDYLGEELGHNCAFGDETPRKENVYHESPEWCPLEEVRPVEESMREQSNIEDMNKYQILAGFAGVMFVHTQKARNAEEAVKLAMFPLEGKKLQHVVQLMQLGLPVPATPLKIERVEMIER